LTLKHTDIYLRRSYSRLQRELRPDTIFFLGDLFDGGREWATSLSQSPESQYWGYREEYWHREHDRFSSIFLRDWSGGHNYPQIIASLPGNHDLGFGTDIQEPVRARFTAFFGESNRIDIIGNHTFVSLDSVSLSAKDKDSDTQDTSALWRQSVDFLDSAEINIAAAVDRHLNLTDVSKPKKYMHTAVDLKDPSDINHPKTVHSSAHTSFPLLLLTHVPLYRPPGTPCGPLRERYPPTRLPPGETNPVEFDEDNAINISHGWQYQNVISRALSLFISEKLGAAIEYVFSGDDHDYCELVHKTYPSKVGGIREITVKSISWAMGVRKPGFLMVSLYNPIDESGSQIPWSEDSLEGGEHFETRRTLQTHLCLLPDQLSIFIRYAMFFGVTVAAFLLRALAVTFSLSSLDMTEHPLLATFGPVGRLRRDSRSVSSGDDAFHPRSTPRRRHSSVDEYQPPFRDGIISHSSRSSRENLTSVPSATSLSSRTVNRAQSRDRNQGYAMASMENGRGPMSFEAGLDPEENYRGEWQARNRRAHGPVASFFIEWLWSLWLVARVVFPWYFWLQWR